MKTYRFFLEDIKQDLYDKIKKNPYYASKLIEKLRLNKRERVRVGAKKLLVTKFREKYCSSSQIFSLPFYKQSVLQGCM